jgi:hypothetical protein
VRGSPILLAHYDGRYYEIFVTDDDFSYDDALLVGQRVYRRDLVTGDSALVFADTAVPRIAATYARAHPDDRPLDPGEEGSDDPATVATVEIDALDILGPYLSYEYHEDLELPGRAPWHATRRGVVDLRSGQQARVADLFGEQLARRLTTVGRNGYEAARDSTLRKGAEGLELSSAGIAALRRIRFDETSFTLSAAGRSPTVNFAIPGAGEGGAGSVLALDPIIAEATAWWREVEAELPDARDGASRWPRHACDLIARADSSTGGADLSLADSAHREWPVAKVSSPIHRVGWLDEPAVSAEDRRALLRAFDEAATYDEQTRVAAAHVTHRQNRTVVAVAFRGRGSGAVAAPSHGRRVHAVASLTRAPALH